MFVDFLTLVMINLVAGTALLAFYLWRGIDEKDQRAYAAAFFGVGLISLVTGLQISFTWPLPGSYNVGYGDATTLFGVVFLATSIALWTGSNLIPVSIYAFFAAVDALVVGIRIYTLGLTKEPLISAVGFILAGLSGLGVFPFLMWFRQNKIVRWIGILLLLGTVLIWGITFYSSLWSHIESFTKWPGILNVPPATGK